MPPQIDDVNTKTGRNVTEALNLNSIKKAIPEEAFEKNGFKSSQYMIRDYICWGTCVVVMQYFVKTAYWSDALWWQKTLAYLVFINLTGFFMWCVFMIGHDCGHTTFAESQLVNDIFGHVTHGSLLVPFYPWQISHRRHHMYHNHETKDYSHPWYTPERLALPEKWLARTLHQNTLALFLIPFYGWQLYLVGEPDGSHLFPVEKARIWKESSPEERNKCWTSLAVILVYLGIFLVACGSITDFLFFYGGPHVMFSWWLICVTYLQHHEHDTVVYNDEDWTFVQAAFETVDRTYGYGIDDIHHNISNGHVVHHLFFTKIPHYHLKTATAALRKYLAENHLSHLYKHVETRDFFLRVHKYMVQFGFKAHKAPASEKKKDN